MAKQSTMLVLVGLPLLVLFLTGIAVTAFLSVNLLVDGVQARAPGTVLLGLLLAAMWLMMLGKTVKARRTTLTVATPEK